MSRPAHQHTTQPRRIGFIGQPGYPALPGAANVCYAIADGCAECLDQAVDDAAGDLDAIAALVAYATEVLVVTASDIAVLPRSGRSRSLPADLGEQPTGPGAPIPGRGFVTAATAAFEASPAACAGNGVPAARETLSHLSDEDRTRALTDAVGLLAVHQPRTERGVDALKALTIA